jgi:hypothetical protein
MDQGDRSNEAPPATGKAQIAQPVVSTIVIASAPPMLPGLLRHARAWTTARSSPPDLITLFGTFLI